jgi:exonuclease III
MKILFWNVRGLNDPFKQREVKKLLRRLKISIFCILETHIKEDKAHSIKEFIASSWGWIHNYGNHWMGRIWVCWDPNIVSVQLLSSNEQALSCRVVSHDSKSWFVSAIYGSNKGVERRTLWQELIEVKGQIGDCPWLIIGGDFNVVKSHQDKWGTSGLSGYEQDFVNCVNRLEVEDLPFSGLFHTWSNKQAGDSFVSKKLDQVVANFGWLPFGNTSVEFLEGVISDHSPAMVSDEEFVSYGPKPFKIFNFWADHKDFLVWIKGGWDVDTSGYSMFRLYTKL